MFIIIYMETEFKEILYAFLKEEALTQTSFAKFIGVRPSQVCDWLKGKAKPSYNILKKISMEFNIPADYFLGITDQY